MSAGQRRLAQAVSLALLAAGAAAECIDRCGALDEKLLRDMNAVACKGLSNYPHPELDACRKGFKVAHTMACFFVCEAMSPEQLPPRGDAAMVASREAACKKAVDAVSDEQVKPWIRTTCHRGYDFGVAQHVLAHPTMAGKDGAEAQNLHPNAWTFTAAMRDGAGARMRALFACLQRSETMSARDAVQCFTQQDARAVKWLSMPLLEHADAEGGVQRFALLPAQDTLRVFRTPATARPGCVFLSVGLDDGLLFERSVLQRTPCRVMALDPREGVGAELAAESVRFQVEPLALGATDGDAQLSTRHSSTPYAPAPVKMATFGTAIEQLHEASAQGLSARDIAFVKIDAPGVEFDALDEVTRLGVPLVRVDFYFSDSRKLAKALVEATERGYGVGYVDGAEDKIFPWQEVGSVVTSASGAHLRMLLFRSPAEPSAPELGGAMGNARQLLAAAVVKKAASVAPPFGSAAP